MKRKIDKEEFTFFWREKKMSETFEVDFRQLFDRVVPFMTVDQMYDCAPFSYHCYAQNHCSVCLPTELYLEICSSDQARRTSNGSEEKRKRYINQFRHEMLNHSTFYTIATVMKNFHKISKQDEVVVPKESEASKENKIVAPKESEASKETECDKCTSDTAVSASTKERPLYKNVITSLHEFYVTQMEECIEKEMLKGHNLTCIFEIPASPIRDYLIEHIDKASGGTFQAKAAPIGLLISLRGQHAPLEPPGK